LLSYDQTQYHAYTENQESSHMKTPLYRENLRAFNDIETKRKPPLYYKTGLSHESQSTRFESLWKDDYSTPNSSEVRNGTLPKSSAQQCKYFSISIHKKISYYIT